MELKEDFKAMGYGKELSTVNDVVYCRNVSFSKRFFFFKNDSKIKPYFL